MDKLRQYGPLAVVLLLVASGVIWAFGSGSNDKLVTAYFPRAVSVYEGSDVRVLGVAIGKVETVVPEGTNVKVTMRYDADTKVPINAKALIVSPSIVGDRYIQLAPVYKSGKVLPDNSVLKADRTAIPLELDEIYSSLDELTVALGPEGANKEGALTDLLEQTAKNFGGEGAKFNQTIEDFGKLSGVLDENKDDLFGSVRQLQSFIKTLAANDGTVRGFNRSLGKVSRMLNGEREELAATLKNLGVALEVVGDFVKDNKTLLTSNIKRANRFVKVLVKRRKELDEVLKIAPLAYNNLGSVYNPTTGTFDTNANLGGTLTDVLLKNPSLFLCGVLGNVDKNGELCNLFKTVLPRSGPFGAGSGSRSGSVYDPTLAGLLEVK